MSAGLLRFASSYDLVIYELDNGLVCIRLSLICNVKINNDQRMPSTMPINFFIVSLSLFSLILCQVMRLILPRLKILLRIYSGVLTFQLTWQRLYLTACHSCRGGNASSKLSGCSKVVCV